MGLHALPSALSCAKTRNRSRCAPLVKARSWSKRGWSKRGACARRHDDQRRRDDCLPHRNLPPHAARAPHPLPPTQPPIVPTRARVPAIPDSIFMNAPPFKSFSTVGFSIEIVFDDWFSLVFQQRRGVGTPCVRALPRAAALQPVMGDAPVPHAPLPPPHPGSRQAASTPPPLVLSGHAASFTPY